MVLEQLETFSINRATLFPEIECVAEYLKNKYMKQFKMPNKEKPSEIVDFRGLLG